MWDYIETPTHILANFWDQVCMPSLVFSRVAMRINLGSHNKAAALSEHITKCQGAHGNHLSALENRI